ncbi:MAG: gephyrin-like molybdotransferase Glp [bacterium]
MIPLPEALAILDSTVRRFPTEDVPVADALGRFLVAPVTAPTDVPAFPRSAMDGFAVKRDDLDRELSVVETVAAGQSPKHAVEPGTAVQIMTGAEVPAGADLVVRVEYAEQRDGRVRFTRREEGTNIIARGENATAGDVVVEPRRMGVHDVGVAAGHGCDVVTVMKAPRVGIISTGDEIREPGEELGPGEIYNSNAFQLDAHSRRYACRSKYYGIAADTPEALRGLLEPALRESDIVLLSGGVSKGEFDYVPGLLAELGVEKRFHRVAMKPGRPTYFGTRPSRPGRPSAAGGDGRRIEPAAADGSVTYVFGLPGNPVSVFVTFEVFVRRLLCGMAGLAGEWETVPVTLGADLKPSDSERTDFIPVAFADGVARPVRYGGSSHLSALSSADALLEVPPGTTELMEGTRVHVRPL